jgi:beta-glucosidase
MTRRALARAVGLASGALALPRFAADAQTPATTARSFPHDFLWGSATASYQVEGAVNEGGRGPTVWDTFSHTPGKTFQGDSGDVADDFYHRYREDIALMKNMGLKAFRFSVAWSRIFPSGTGAPNQQGLDFYKRLVDALLEAGIQPFCTLFHWDLPQPLEDRGGWENKDTAKAFAEYAGYTAAKLSDKVTHFMTMNEMRTFVELGYRDGIHAPGKRLDPKRLAQLNHYVVLAHGLAVQSIRAQAKAGTKVGIADNVSLPVPVIEEPREIEAAHRAIREENAMFLNVLMEGRYTELYLKKLGSAAPHFTPEEMAIIGSKMDFLGINVYQPIYVRADSSPAGYTVVPEPSSFPSMYSPWLKVGPEGLYWAPKLAADVWKVKEIYITENGCSSDDQIAPDGQVYDLDRVMFLRNYLSWLQRAVAEGVPVKGYMLWSLLDNFEWADGYSKRFGIVYVDFKTQKRTPKLSAEFYKKVVAAGRVL